MTPSLQMHCPASLCVVCLFVVVFNAVVLVYPDVVTYVTVECVENHTNPSSGKTSKTVTLPPPPPAPLRPPCVCVCVSLLVADIVTVVEKCPILHWDPNRSDPYTMVTSESTSTQNTDRTVVSQLLLPLTNNHQFGLNQIEEKNKDVVWMLCLCFQCQRLVLMICKERQSRRAHGWRREEPLTLPSWGTDSESSIFR